MASNEFRQRNTRAAKITPQQVLELREWYSRGASQAELARHYKLSVNQVGKIVRGESWQNLTAGGHAAPERLPAFHGTATGIMPVPMVVSETIKELMEDEEKLRIQESQRKLREMLGMGVEMGADDKDKDDDNPPTAADYDNDCAPD